MIEIKRHSDKKEPDYFTKIFEKEGEAKVVKKESEKKPFSVWTVLKDQLVRKSTKKAQVEAPEEEYADSHTTMVEYINDYIANRAGTSDINELYNFIKKVLDTGAVDLTFNSK